MKRGKNTALPLFIDIGYGMIQKDLIAPVFQIFGDQDYHRAGLQPMTEENRVIRVAPGGHQ